MIEDLMELYSHSGEWGDPIVLSTLLLFVTGWIMLFTVRLIKKFVFYSIVALLLPNSIGVIGYVETVADLQESVLERGEELHEELVESAEDLTFSPIYLGLAGSFITLALGIAGIMKSRRNALPAPPRPNP